MDPNINIMKRQMAEEVKEKYALYRRIDDLIKKTSDLTEEVEHLKEKIKKLEEKSK